MLMPLLTLMPSRLDESLIIPILFPLHEHILVLPSPIRRIRRIRTIRRRRRHRAAAGIRVMFWLLMKISRARLLIDR
jgi:hypothetical protein